MIIYHHNDADGRCAGALAVRWRDRNRPQERCSGYEMDYTQQDLIEPEKQIEPGETVCILDFSFKPDMMRRIEARTSDIIWCDHHASAELYGYTYKGVRDFSNKGCCGAECAYRYFFPGSLMPNFLELLGDYDSWRMKRKDECLPFYEGLKMEDTSIITGIWFRLMDDEPGLVTRIKENGASIIKYRDQYCSDMRTHYGYETVIDGHKAFAMNVYRFGNAQFGPLFNEYPVCLAYVYDGRKFIVSMYAREVDVSVIAKKYGGGGHKGAAGFVCDNLPFKFSGGFGGE